MSELTKFPGAPDIESSTADYQKRFSGKVGSWFLDVQDSATEAVLSKLGNTSSLNVVDVGGGHGQNIKKVLSMGHKLTIVGSDASCKQLIESSIADGSISFLQGSLLDLPCEDGAFDVVLSYRMLAHLQDWQRHIKELTRVSEQLVIVDFPTIRSVNYFSGALFGLKSKVEKNTRYYKLFTEQEVVNEFAIHDFVPLYKVGQFVLPMALHRAMKLKNLSKILEVALKFTGVSRYFSSPLIYGFIRKNQL